MATSKKAAAKTGSATKSAGKTASGSTSRAGGSSRAAGLPSFGDLGKALGKLQLPGLDVAAIVDAQRKDMEALAEANRQAYEGIKALAKRRNEILRDAMAEWQQAMKGMTDAGGQDALKKQTELARKGVQQAIANFRELAEMEAESRKKAWKVVQDRFEENLANLKKLLQPKKGD